MPEHDDESFLVRWSRRKRAGDRADRTVPPDNKTDDDAHSAQNAASDDPGNEHPGIAAKANPGERTIPADDDTELAVPDDLAGVDIDSMTYDSDFERFLKKDVPPALRRRALRQLWRSDPILANVDGLNDYDDDFTDAALAVKVLQTAHKVGRGYLDDDEEVEEDDGSAQEQMADTEGASSDPAEPDNTEVATGATEDEDQQGSANPENSHDDGPAGRDVDGEPDADMEPGEIAKDGARSSQET